MDVINADIIDAPTVRKHIGDTLGPQAVSEYDDFRRNTYKESLSGDYKEIANKLSSALHSVDKINLAEAVANWRDTIFSLLTIYRPLEVHWVN